MSEIKIIHGSCADQNVDVIVNAANPELQAGGGICGAIFSKAGLRELQDECNKYQPIGRGEVVKTGAYKITNCRSIFHAVGPDFRDDLNQLDKLYNAYYNSLELLMNNDYHSISFPLISAAIYAGKLPNPVEHSTEECIKAYYDFISKYPEYDINVLLCAFTDDEYLEASTEAKKLIRK